jgi:pSer/pThr/pTyr-binding forkhead associated (FHA) protein
VRVVIDHVAGSRRGQRQEFPADRRVQFGRHPECEVSFDPHRDIDASTRHAELRATGSAWLLVDLGSSNGTYADGRRITEAPVARNQAVDVEFGSGGPRVRVFVGDDREIEALPPAPITTRRVPLHFAIAGAVAAVAAILVLATC